MVFKQIHTHTHTLMSRYVPMELPCRPVTYTWNDSAPGPILYLYTGIKFHVAAGVTDVPQLRAFGQVLASLYDKSTFISQMALTCGLVHVKPACVQDVSDFPQDHVVMPCVLSLI